MPGDSHVQMGSDFYQLPSDQVLIIEPGSQYLRIGRASDTHPVVVRHVVARRRPSSTAADHCTRVDTVLPAEVALTRSQTLQMEEARATMARTLQSALRSDGSARSPAPASKVAGFNKLVHPERINEPVPEWTPAEGEIVVGEDALRLDPSGPFNVHYPMRRGRLNVHSGVAGSLTAIAADLRDIWRFCIETKLQIKPQSLCHYKVVLVIPCIFKRAHIKTMVDILMTELGVRAFLLVQNHMAASFGSCQPVACVVDIGDQKTSVSCVEDGLSLRGSGVHLDYGGGDVTRTLLWLLRKNAFPYRQCNSLLALDVLLLDRLKSTFCHVDLDICGAVERKFQVCKPHHAPLEYTVHLGDECVVAALGYFAPALFHLSGAAKISRLQEGHLTDADDPLDAGFITETGRKRDVPDSAGVESLAGDNGGDMLVEDKVDPDLGSAPHQLDRLLSVDQAILYSIDQCSRDNDLKRRLYSCVVLVGGGAGKFTGLSTWLSSRLSMQIPDQLRPERLEIVTEPRGQDPALVNWKGASIMACMDTAAELWITQLEWRTLGTRVLREKATFDW